MSTEQPIKIRPNVGYLCFGEPGPEIRIGFDGTVTIPEGITLDEAAREFWKAVERLAPNRGA